jgi:uridine phosphorylase
VVSTHGLGIDNLLNFYQPKRTAEEEQILQAFITHTQFQQQLGPSYVCSGSPSLLKMFTQGFHPGITVTCPGFYGPQGRVLRLGLSQPQLVDRLSDFRIGPHRITNFEMETSALYGLGRLLGHQCLSVNVIIANRIRQQYSKDMMRSMDKMITQTLERLASQ